MKHVSKKTILYLLWGTVQILQCQLYAQQSVADKGIKTLAGKMVSPDSLENFISHQMKALDVPAISMAVINDGELVYQLSKGYADTGQKVPAVATTIFEGASLSKPLFAYFVMGFVEEGVLDLDRPLYKYLPYQDIAHDQRYKKITARMVLAHTGGFPNWRTDHEGGALFISFDPGTAFQYSGEGYQYLAKVLAHILDTDDAGLERAFQKRVARPLNLKYTKYLQDAENMNNKALGYKDGKPVGEDDDPTIFGSAFSVHSNAVDFSNWLLALLRKKGLSQASFQALFETQITLPEGHPQTQTGISDWTLGFAKANFPFGSIYAHGGNNPGYTSIFLIAPDAKWGYVMFTNGDQTPLPLVVLQYLMTP